MSDEEFFAAVMQLLRKRGHMIHPAPLARAFLEVEKAWPLGGNDGRNVTPKESVVEV